MVLGICGVGLLFSQAVSAHGIVSSEVTRLKAELQSNYDDIDLRAEYVTKLTAIEHFDEAREELAVIRKLDPTNASVDWLGAQISFGAANYEDAVKDIDRHLQTDAFDGRAMALKGRALTKLGRHRQAAQSFSDGLQVGHLTSDLFVYAADAYQAAGDFGAAVQHLEQGLLYLGDLPLFYLKIANLEAGQGNYESAADVMGRLMATMSSDLRSEAYAAQRGDYLLAAGQYAAARDAYEQAMTDLMSRSERIRKMPASQQLLKKLNTSLGDLTQGGVK